MNILYLIDEYPVLSETFIRNEMIEMKRQNNKISIYTYKSGEDEGIEQEVLDYTNLNKDVLYSKSEFLKDIILNITNLKEIFKQKRISKHSLLYQSLKLASEIRKNKIDHVMIHFGENSAIIGTLAAKIAKVTSSVTYHGHDVHKNHYDLKFKLTMASYSFFVSKELKDLAEEYLDEKEKKELEYRNIIVPMGINTNKKLKIENNKNNKYIFIGRFNKVKGIEHILNTWKRNEMKEIHLIGYGEEEELIRKQINEHKLNIKILGKKNSDWIFSNLPYYNAIILPFQENKETKEKDTGSLVLKESMFIGIPIITTDIMPHIVTNNEAFIIHSFKKNNLYKKIKEFESINKEKIESKLKKAKIKVEKEYSVKKQVEQILKCLKQ